MLIAILSDIHGNADALKNVLNEARSLGVEKLLVLGDILGYYYDSKTVINDLLKWDHEMIRGNHEDLFELCLSSDEESQKYKKKYGSSLELSKNLLNNEEIFFLKSLPKTKNLEIDSVKIQICHGSPQNTDEYIYPNADLTKLQSLSNPGFDFIFMGHTHHPFVFQNQQTTLVNVGSVGQPRDTGNISSWFTLNTKNRVLIPRRTFFQTEELINSCRKNDPHLSYLTDVLNRGYKKI